MLIRRVYRIFQRYADAHVTLEVPVSADDRQIGPVHLIRAYVANNRIHVEFKGHADRIEIQIGRSVVPAVADTRTETEPRSYVDVPLDVGPIVVRVAADDVQHERSIPAVSALGLAWRRRWQAVRYTGQLLALSPQIFRWKVLGDLGAREVVKERLGLVNRPKAHAIDGAVFGGDDEKGVPASAATIVMPVFNAFDLLSDVLDRVARNSGASKRLVLVDDGSDDARVLPFLKAWCADPARGRWVHLVEKPRNDGFVRAANEGLTFAQQWPDDPVVLLNTDAFVPMGWLDRLLAPLGDPQVASVTPMSNDAEIFSVPVMSGRSELQPGAVDEIDAVARQLSATAAQCEVPTGVGFCMAMAPGFLKKVPLFDEAFGRGYGEENDWCQKTRAMGGRHIAIGNLFVEHRGGVSFGSASKQRLLEANLAKLAKRYPTYDAQVQGFLQADPMVTARLALGLAWASAQQEGPVSVYVGHAMGGGADMDLDRRIDEEVASGRAAVVVRVGLWRRWQIELHSSLGTVLGATDDTSVLLALIERLKSRRIVYSCGVGDRDPMELPGIMIQMADGGRHHIEVLVHDYFPVSPAYTLLGSDGRYQGPPRADGPCASDAAHSANGIGLMDWQKVWGDLMTAATRVEVFSGSSARIIADVYPVAARKTVVNPHKVTRRPPVISPVLDAATGPVIGVLGNIGVQKGAAVVQALAREMAESGSGRLVVIGHLDADFSLAAPSVVHGGYEMRDLPGLVARYGITCWMIPSIWPETFSFTTHEALATGMPVFAFDLGAQGDAVAASPKGAVLSLPDGNAPSAAAILEHQLVREVGSRA